MLVRDPDAENAVMFAGDLRQKVVSKHHRPVNAGFNFQGRSRNLVQNHRNTRQILNAAYTVAKQYPSIVTEPSMLTKAKCSDINGERPLCIECDIEDQTRLATDLAFRSKGRSVAILSRNPPALDMVAKQLAERGIRVHRLLRNETGAYIDFAAGTGLVRPVFVGSMEIAKGLEFDTVILMDVRNGVIPMQSVHNEELWREGAVLYSAMTRARDELFMIVPKHPAGASIFLDCMGSHIERLTLDGQQVEERLRSRGSKPGVGE